MKLLRCKRNLFNQQIFKKFKMKNIKHNSMKKSKIKTKTKQLKAEEKLEGLSQFSLEIKEIKKGIRAKTTK